jgi:hypothetical protein
MGFRNCFIIWSELNFSPARDRWTMLLNSHPMLLFTQSLFFLRFQRSSSRQS